MALTDPFRGILPAMQCPFNDDFTIDEAELRRFANWLAGHDGIGGLVTNGHTGEIFSLPVRDRNEVTRIVADEMAGRLPVVHGLSCEGIMQAEDEAGQAKEAGAAGLLVMPPHHWLRFSMEPEHVIEYFTAIGKAVDINLVVHVYPAWTKAGYSPQLLADLGQIPQVTTFKVGTREMSQYARDITALREQAPETTILTCHDEYLLTSMVQGVDGALVGFASLIPDLITGLYQAVCDGDLKTAQAIQARILPLKEVVYATGEPSSEAHSRMKMAMYLAGRLKSPVVRRPIEQPTGETLEGIKRAVEGANLEQVRRQAAE
jgi:4-hydroxy-tetrahydrodipicolinate synthase